MYPKKLAFPLCGMVVQQKGRALTFCNICCHNKRLKSYVILGTPLRHHSPYASQHDEQVTAGTHTSEKCFHLRDNLIRVSAQCREDAALMIPALNRQYRLIHSINRDKGYKKEQAHARKLLTLA